MPIEITGFLILSLIIVLVAVVFASQGIKVVPQQTAWVVERLGKFHAVLSPGLNFIIPFIDRVAYRHSLKEIPLDTPSQVCITRSSLWTACFSFRLPIRSGRATAPRTTLLLSLSLLRQRCAAW